MKNFRILFLLLIFAFFLLIPNVFAHEAYVLSAAQFKQGLSVFDQHPFAPLFEPSNLPVVEKITILVLIGMFVCFMLSVTKLAAIVHKTLRLAKKFGPLIVRIAISASFFYAAEANVILGPELTLVGVAGAVVIRFCLFLISLMILFGVFTEVAAFIGLGLFFYISTYYGAYMITYANYFGELLILLFFGSRFMSFDKFFFGDKLWIKKFEKWREYEAPILRILYAVALIYAGVTVKFLHQQLTIDVYNQYHLFNYFHLDAALVAAGAGVSEVIIGLFILFGFLQRYTILTSLVFITLSILYFHELLWPHFMLYGPSIALFINSSDKLTVDSRMIKWLRNKMSIALPKSLIDK